MCDKYLDNYNVRRDRSVISRHLNRLVNLGLAERTEIGRAAKYLPTPSLRMAVDLEHYPKIKID